MIIIGDIHGCFKTFQALLKKLPKNEVKVCTGDIIDRGRDSKKVVDFFRDNKEEFLCVRGNHENELLKLFNFSNFRDVSFYAQIGGATTLKSFNVKKCNAIPKKYIEYLKSLPLFIKKDDLIISHAAICNDLDYAVKHYPKDHGILWYRGITDVPEGCYHVHGHTPVEKPLVTDNFTNIDTGCCFDGFLSAIQYPSKKLFIQENIE